MYLASLKVAALLLLGALVVDGQASVAPTSAPSCSSGSETVTWNISADTNVLGGIQTSDTTVQGCQATCRNNRTCTGFDWDSNAIAVTKCWLTGPWSGLRRTGATGVTHYDIVRKSNCASCAPTWSAPIANTNVNGGTNYPAVTTLAECQQKCADAGPTRCYGIDWDSNSVATSKCWVTTNNGTKRTGLAAGVDHYDATWPDSAACNPAARGCILASDTKNRVVGISSDYMQLVVSDDLDKAVVFQEVPCRLTVLPDLLNTESCVSYVVGNRPGYYIRVIKGYLYIAQQDEHVSTQWPDSFDEDASFIKRTVGLNLFELHAVTYPTFTVKLDGSDPNGPVTFANNQSTDAEKFYCLSAAIDDQSIISDTCPNIWSIIPHAKISRPSSASNVSDPRNCRTDGLINSGTTGVSEYHPVTTKAIDKECYFMSDALVNSPLTYDPDYTHFDFWPVAQMYCQRGCFYKWDYLGTQSVPSIGIATEYARNLYECKKICIQDYKYQCKGITYRSGTNCIIYLQNATPEWKLTTIYDACGPCMNSFGVQYGWTDSSATAVGTVTGFGPCRTICINRRGCSGYEIRSDGICYVSNNWTATMVNTGDMTSYYTAMYRTTCGNGCVHKWELYPGTRILTGQGIVNAVDVITERSCRTACINEPTCTSCDFDSTSRLCALGISNPKINWNAGPSWNHFELVRNYKCDDV